MVDDEIRLDQLRGPGGLPRALRLGAATSDSLRLEMDAHGAIQLARIVERGLAPERLVEVPVPVEPPQSVFSNIWMSCMIGITVVAVVEPVAMILAGWFQP